MYSLWDDIPPEAQAIIRDQKPDLEPELRRCQYGRRIRITTRPTIAERNRTLVRIYQDLLRAGVDRTFAVEQAAASVGLGWRMGYKVLARRDLY